MKREKLTMRFAGPDETSLLPALHSIQLSTYKSAASTAAEPELSKTETSLQWLKYPR